MSIIQDGENLFSNGDLRPALEHHGRTMTVAIDAYSSDLLLRTAVDDLVRFFVDETKVEPLALEEQAITLAQSETTIDAGRLPDHWGFQRFGPPSIAATEIRYSIPFTGEPTLFKPRPSSWSTSMPPRGRIHNNEVILSFSTTDADPDAVKKAFVQQLDILKRCIQATTSDVNTFNNGLVATATAAVTARRNRLLDARQMTARLGFPLRERPGMPLTFIAPEVRRKVVPPLPSAGAFQPEPELSLENYEHILSIVQNMVLVMERSPSAFSMMKEEDLRVHFLVQLNGHFEGSAIGETFNGDGKTDILIRVGNKNLFIAECKFWHGAEGFRKTVDQLLGYVSWRDTKTAIFLFNRGTESTTIAGQVRPLLEAHPNFKRSLPLNGETCWRAILHHGGDRNRELTLTVVLFNVPADVAKKEPGTQPSPIDPQPQKRPRKKAGGTKAK